MEKIYARIEESKNILLNEYLKIEKILIDILKATPHQMLCLNSNDVSGALDYIFGYYYQDYSGEVVERKIECLKLENDKVLLYMNTDGDTFYENRDLKYFLDTQIDDDSWFSLYGGDCLSWNTLNSLIETIGEYIECPTFSVI